MQMICDPLTVVGKVADCGTTVNYKDPIFCCPIVSVECAPSAGSFFGFGEHQVQCLGYDESGQTVDSCTKTINVVANEKPQIESNVDSCVAVDICTEPFDMAFVSLEANVSDPTCDGRTVTISYEIVLGNSGGILTDVGGNASGNYPVGKHNITWNTEDNFGNKNSLTESFEVKEGFMLECPNDISMNAGDELGLDIEFEVDSPSICGMVVTVSCNPPSGSFFIVQDDPHQVVCSVEVNGLTFECSFNITITGDNARKLVNQLLGSCLDFGDSDPRIEKIEELINHYKSIQLKVRQLLYTNISNHIYNWNWQYRQLLDELEVAIDLLNKIKTNIEEKEFTEVCTETLQFYQFLVHAKWLVVTDQKGTVIDKTEDIHDICNYGALYPEKCYSRCLKLREEDTLTI